MKRIRIPQHIFTFGLIFFFLGSLPLLHKGGGKELGEDAPVRFDGFYYKRGIMRPGQQQAPGYTYFRFYPDRTVVMTTSASEPEQVERRFGRGYNQADAKFKLYEKGGSPGIRFNIKHFGVSQLYEGQAGRDSLKLWLYGAQSEFEYHDVYLFYEAKDMRE